MTFVEFRAWSEPVGRLGGAAAAGEISDRTPPRVARGNQFIVVREGPPICTPWAALLFSPTEI